MQLLLPCRSCCSLRCVEAALSASGLLLRSLSIFAGMDLDMLGVFLPPLLLLDPSEAEVRGRRERTCRKLCIGH